MKKPQIHINNQNGIVEREMTDEEYADLIASGWTPGEETETE